MEREVDYGRFRRLLENIESGDVRIRIRNAGESWSGFSQVLLLSENAMILQENGRRRIVMNLRHIEEFELDREHFDCEPNVPYKVQKG